MADTEVKAEEPAKSAGEKPVKKGSFFKKYSVWIAGGGAVILAVFWLMSRNSGSSSAQANQAAAQNAATQGGIDPGTGYLYGSPADIAALGGSGSVAATPGPQGPAGAAGPAGAQGAAGTGFSNGPGGTNVTSGPIFEKLNFSQAQALAGRSGSSSLFYNNGGRVTQGKYANDRNVQYYKKIG